MIAISVAIGVFVAYIIQFMMFLMNLKKVDTRAKLKVIRLRMKNSKLQRQKASKQNISWGVYENLAEYHYGISRNNISKKNEIDSNELTKYYYGK